MLKIIISPLKTEIGLFLKTRNPTKIYSRKHLKVYRLDSPGGQTIIAVTGMGKAKTLSSLKDFMGYLKDKGLLGGDNRKKLLLTGFCGSVKEDINVGDMVRYSRIIYLIKKQNSEKVDLFIKEDEITLDTRNADLSTFGGYNFSTVSGANLPEVLGDVDKKISTGKEFDCSVIDMESYWVARKLAPYFDLIIAKAVSDDTKEDFYEGRFIALKIFFSLFSPSPPSLLQAIKNIKTARVKLCEFLNRYLGYS